MTASVSVLKGRSTKVAGNSFMTSTHTSSKAVAAEGRSKGQCTRQNTSRAGEPSMRALSSALIDMRE